ncbi:MAG: hypothetical protein AAB553_04545 [Patescibacteria group bacterium]
MPDSLHIVKQRLAYAKLVATPTDIAWSQAYNAGNLFASLSLAQTTEEIQSLPTLGKTIFSNLEAEFFTLEDKNLDGIKQAIAESIKTLPEHIELSFCLCYFKDDLLYLFIAGSGKILIKRRNSLGVLLEKHTPTERVIHSSSGYADNDDIFILQTAQFAKDIPSATLTAAMEVTLPSDIAEILSPHLHQQEDGGQAAIIVAVQGIPKRDELLEEEERQESDEEPTLATAIREEQQYKADYDDMDASTSSRPAISITPLVNKLTAITHKFMPKMHLSNVRKVTLAVAILLIVLLIGGIGMTKYREEQKEKQKLFQVTISEAQKYYDEGKALKNLNPELSEEAFAKADAIIVKEQDTFSAGSKEGKALATLRDTIRKEKTPITETAKAEIATTEATDDASPFLTTEQKVNAISFGQNVSTIYAVTKEDIIAIPKAGGNEKSLISNDDGWAGAVAIAPYQANIYVLDTKEGILKYVPGGGGYGKTAYFKDKAPDVSGAVAMAIDSDVFILKKDGSILKYTSGEAVKFTVTGLKQALRSPTKIVTDSEMTRLYVLDKGNKRIVVLSKDGAFIKEYPADILTQAEDLDVQEEDKKIIILAKDKLWEIPL